MTKMWTQILLALMGFGIFVTGFAYYHHSVYEDGFHDAEKQYQAKEENTRMEAERTLAAAVKAERDKQTALQSQIDTISTRRKQEQDHADAENQSLRASLAAGTRRVSVPAATACPVPGSAPVATTTAAARTQPEARCELSNQTALDLERIASDGDAAIRQANALIDVYEQARTAQ